MRSAFAAILALAAAPAAAQDLPAAADDYAKLPDRYICVLRAAATLKPGILAPDSAADERVEAAALAAVRAEGGAVRHVYRSALKGFSARMSAAAARRLQRGDPNVAWCQQDGEVRALQTAGTVVSQPKERTMWNVLRVGGGQTYTGPNRAWVIDTGIELTHPDLNVDVARSRSFLPVDGSPNDAHGHGTHVAGVIGAVDNAIGVVGVAAGAPVVAVRVLDAQGNGSDADVIAGIDYAAANAAPGDVLNLSLGGAVSPAMDMAVLAAAARGLHVTIAAGNSKKHADTFSPARAEGPGVHTVSAMKQGDLWASFSNFGNPPVDWAAPGYGILSTHKGARYVRLSGTSMAAPHVAGLLLLGPLRDGGRVSGDPDGNPDVIAVR